MIKKDFLENIKTNVVSINEKIYDNIIFSIEKIEELKYIKEKICQQEHCKWIISKLDLQTNKEVKINIEPTDEIFIFLINILGNNLKVMLNNYLNYDTEYDINIIDVYVELISKKEKANDPTDESEITAILCLTNKEEKDEGGIDFFEKIIKIKSGELLICNTYRKYAFINNDKQYYLFIKIKILKK